MKSKVFIVISFLIIGLMIGVYVGFHLSFVKVSPQECTLKEFSKGSYSGRHYGRTQDGVLCNVSYSWYIDHTIDEDEYAKIDLVLKRTIAKSFTYYKYDQITKIPDDFIVDFKSRLEDAVFAIEPLGFTLTNVFITKYTPK
jgi:hypothetical protein